MKFFCEKNLEIVNISWNRVKICEIDLTLTKKIYKNRSKYKKEVPTKLVVVTGACFYPFSLTPSVSEWTYTESIEHEFAFFNRYVYYDYSCHFVWLVFLSIYKFH